MAKPKVSDLRDWIFHWLFACACVALIAHLGKSWSSIAPHLQEDGSVETVQATLYLLTAFFCFSVALKTSKHWQWMRVVYGLTALIFLLIFMEEISWGQRIFGFATPEAVKNINSQKELNIHNISNRHTWIAYMILSVYGTFSGVLLAAVALRFPHLRGLHPFVVPVRFALYFPAMGIYAATLYCKCNLGGFFSKYWWGMQEAFELILALGCALSAWYQWRHLNSSKKTVS